MARSEDWSCPLRLPTPAAAHVAIASGVSQRVTSPRRTRARSYGPVPDAILCLVLRMHSRLHIEIMTRRRSRWSTCRPLLAHRAESAHQRLNEGRSVNPGYTLTRKMPDASARRAQRRPERQPRLHADVLDLHHCALLRSTKAGASTPATLIRHWRRGWLLVNAQRRPEHQLRRHPGRGRVHHAVDRQRRPEHQLRRHATTSRLAWSQEPAQRRPEHQLRRHNTPSDVPPPDSAAQRRPEHQLRRHRPSSRPRATIQTSRRPSINSGDTW